MFPAPFSLVASFLASADPRLLAPETLTDYLSAAERLQWQRISERALEKRQREWLLGRYTVKHAVRGFHASRGEEPPAWSEISIEPDRHGKPHVVLTGPRQMGSPAISLSHTQGALLAIAADADSAVGVDIESVRRSLRDVEAFGRLTLSEAERQWLEAQTSAEHALMYLWTAKEAAAKAIGTGLQGRPKDFQLCGDPFNDQAEVVTPKGRIPVLFRRVDDYLCALAHRAAAMTDS